MFERDEGHEARSRGRVVRWTLVGACVMAAAAGATSGSLVLTGANAWQMPGASPTRLAPAAGSSGTRITRVNIDNVESPAFGGRAFGSVGRYEQLFGQVYGELDPADPRNALIVNLDRAPRNANGMVAYSVEFRLLKPIDTSRGNRTILYDVLTGDNQSAFNLHLDLEGTRGTYPPTAEELGDAFLLNQGYTIVWSAWQGDRRPTEGHLIAQFPIATRPDGGPIRRWISTEFLFERPTRFARLQGETARSYPAVAETMPKATLYRQASPHAPLEPLRRESWSFAKCDGSQSPVASSVDVCLPEGFSSNHLYRLVYEAQDPIVMGIGFAAIRDVVSLLRYDTTSVNPLVPRGGRPNVRWAIMFGQLQNGRLVKDFIYEGFNQDTAGRIVFDGAIVQASGSHRTFTNLGFAEPERSSRPVEDHYSPGDQFPFSYETITDPVSGRVDGLLARCRITASCPKIMHWDTGSEAWVARASLVVTDPLGTIDLPVPENVRVYYFASTQRQGGEGTDPTPASRGICEQLLNPSPYRETERALLVALQAWVASGRPPPASQYPRLSDGTLVPPLPQAAQGFPAIPGVRYSGKLNDLFVNDYFTLPTRHTTAEYKVLVPKVDRDGNDLAGIRSTMIQAPLGTSTGWNLRRTGFMEGEVCGTNGSYIPFASRASDRGSDPRLSLEERYATQAGYVKAVQAAAERLEQTGFLLHQDAERLVREAAERKLGL